MIAIAKHGMQLLGGAACFLGCIWVFASALAGMIAP